MGIAVATDVFQQVMTDMFHNKAYVKVYLKFKMLYAYKG